jgi:hypothetical protein
MTPNRGYEAVYKKLRANLMRKSQSRRYASRITAEFTESRQSVDHFEAAKEIVQVVSGGK